MSVTAAKPATNYPFTPTTMNNLTLLPLSQTRTNTNSPSPPPKAPTNLITNLNSMCSTNPAPKLVYFQKDTPYKAPVPSSSLHALSHLSHNSIPRLHSGFSVIVVFLLTIFSLPPLAGAIPFPAGLPNISRCPPRSPCSLIPIL